MRSAIAICLTALTAMALLAETPDAAPTSKPAARRESLLDDGSLLDGSSIPVTLPTIIDRKPIVRRKPAIREGVTIFDRRTGVRADPTGKWWIIDDPKAGHLYLLPCQLLESIEGLRAREGDVEMKLSGETYHYNAKHYLMLRRVLRITDDEKRAPAPAVATPIATPTVATTRPATTTQPTATTQPAATADDVTEALLSETMGRPVIPPATPVERKDPTPSVAPTNEPLPAGPGQMIINRLGRISPAAGGWRLLTFEADNTLREPPVWIMPNEHLRWMEAMNNACRDREVVFRVSGEIHQYRGQQFLLIRSAIQKRNLDQF